jgi:hypothetical protein
VNLIGVVKSPFEEEEGIHGMKTILLVYDLAMVSLP